MLPDPCPRRDPKRRRFALAVAIGAAVSCFGARALAQGAVPRGGSGAAVAPDKTPDKPAPGPQVIPPQLKQFVSATYPADAEKQGLEGNVVLQLDIDAEGKVTGATVVNPAGHGFDEAAAEAAKQFTFAPALRNGKAVAARILYRYSFTLAVKVKDPGASDKGAGGPPVPTTTLSGAVRAGTDVPIAGANVIVRDVNGQEKTARTGEDGAWSLIDLPPGQYTVLVQAPGYQKLEVQENVARGEATEVVYRLVPEGELQVVIRGTRPPREVTRRTLERREIERIPGTNGDALRSLQNLPGVARPPGFAGLLIVRGSAPNDTAVFVDGTSIPLIYHFGGLSSAVPTELLEKIDFYPGNFSAQFGRVTGGVVDVGLRSPKSDGKYHGMGQFDLIDGRALLEGPVPFVKGWNFAAAFRRSWVDTWLKPVLTSLGTSVSAAPVYYDWQLYAETKPSPRSSFRVSFLGSDDRLELLVKDTADVDPVLTGNLKAHTGFLRLMARYQNDLSDDVSLSSVTAYGKNTIEVGLGALFFNTQSYPLTNRTELTARLGHGATAHVGLDMFYSNADADVRAPQPPRPGEPSAGPFATRPPLRLIASNSIYRPGAYAELEMVPYRRLKLVPGIRVDYASMVNVWDVSPRFNARYALIEGFPRTTLKGGVGVYHAPPQVSETFPPFGSRTIHSNRAIHYALGFEQDLTRQIEVSFEGFYKDLDQLVSRTPDETGGFSYANLGSGYVVGTETLIKYKPDSRFFGWLAYTLSRSMRRPMPDEPLALFMWDQTHILTVLGSYRLGRGWEFGARFRLVTGNAVTPIVGSLYNANSGSYVEIRASETKNERLPMFNQLDLRVDKRWDYGTWKLSTYLDVQNVYWAQNVEDYNYNYNYTQRTKITGLPIIPSLGVRGEF
ncbi:MAG: TonB family protein [Deltaproteobacteria bacterium]|nr:TonB family protein [Deltaproteobacteria bacterium]